MTQEPEVPTTSPSKLAITKALAEAEAKRMRAVRYSWLAVLVPLLIGGALFGYTFYKVKRNIDRNRELEAKLGELNEKVSARQAQLDVLNLSERQLRERLESLATTFNTFSKSAAEADSPEKLKALQGDILKTIEADPQTNLVAESLAAARPRVYIQIGSESQRERAARVGDALRKLDFIVPGIEKVARVPTAPEVRYFRPGDRDTATRIVDALGEAKLLTATARQSDVKAPPGQLELWFATEADEGARGDLKGKGEELKDRPRANNTAQNSGQPPQPKKTPR